MLDDKAKAENKVRDRSSRDLNLQSKSTNSPRKPINDGTNIFPFISILLTLALRQDCEAVPVQFPPSFLEKIGYQSFSILATKNIRLSDSPALLEVNISSGSLPDKSSKISRLFEVTVWVYH